MNKDKLEFTEEAIKSYLDSCIKLWRSKKEEAIELEVPEQATIATSYIDAFQSVRTSIFGEILP